MKYEYFAHITHGEPRLTTRIPKPTSTMRKALRQARSGATIEVILESVARILGERGWAATTTNAAAETAGVSIGSLYHPNKLALVEAVRRRRFDEVLAVLRAPTDTAAPRTRRIAAQILAAAVAVHDAARLELLASPPFKRELIALVESSLTRRRAAGSGNDGASRSSQRNSVLQTRGDLVGGRCQLLVQPWSCACAADLVHTVEHRHLDRMRMT